MFQRRFYLILLFFSFCISSVYAQYRTKEEIEEYFEEESLFSIYKDNYFISGIPIDTGIEKTNADIKYQLSVRQRLTRKSLPWNTQLYMSYTQKAFWHIWARSSPFEEIVFNPTIAVQKPLFNSKNEVNSLATLVLEHQSNGRDSIQSRSWNMVKLSYLRRISEKTLVGAEVWAPFWYHEDNPDILDYVGIYKLRLVHEIIPNKLNVDVHLQKGLKWNWNGVARTRLFYSPFKKTDTIPKSV